MTKRISPAAIQALKEALSTVYWYKNDLKRFLLTALGPGLVVNKLDWDNNKRNIVGNLSTALQQRGYALERMLRQIFELFDMDPRASFKITGEQIDGAFTFDKTDYLLEAKWQQELVGIAQLDAFNGKISRKLANTLGLFLSINGYSPDAVSLHATHRPVMILMDGSDLMAVLEGRIELSTLLLRKRKHAAHTGELYLPIQRVLG